MALVICRSRAGRAPGVRQLPLEPRARPLEIGDVGALRGVGVDRGLELGPREAQLVSHLRGRSAFVCKRRLGQLELDAETPGDRELIVDLPLRALGAAALRTQLLAQGVGGGPLRVELGAERRRAGARGVEDGLRLRHRGGSLRLRVQLRLEGGARRRGRRLGGRDSGEIHDQALERRARIGIRQGVLERGEPDVELGAQLVELALRRGGERLNGIHQRSQRTDYSFGLCRHTRTRRTARLSG